MKKLTKVLTLGAMFIALTATSLTALAASNYNTPAEAVAGLTEQTVESVIAEKKESGTTYGAIADQAGKLAEFKSEVLEIKKDTLAQKVEAGTITQEKADEIIAAIEEKIATCDPTQPLKIGKSLGAGFGEKNGQGQCDGLKDGQGQGQGKGMNRGQGNNMGICTAQ